MPPKRFEGKFGIPSSHSTESLLTSALYRLPESVTPQFIEDLVEDVSNAVDEHRVDLGAEQLTKEEKQMLSLKLARHYEENGESAPIDRATFIDALVESPKFLRNDRGSIAKLFEIHEMKTLQKIAEIRRKRAEMTVENTELNPYENLFETESGEYYFARLLNMPHLEEESMYMNHCVGTSTSYINKMKRGDVEIFSLRKKDDHEPVVTVEYDARSQKLLQVKGYDNYVPTLSDPFAFDLIEALERLPETVNDEGKKRIIKGKETAHLKHLLSLQKKIELSLDELSQDDLRFLYEIDEQIQGFDNHGQEPLVRLLRSKRNIREDVSALFGCELSRIADFHGLKKDTLVYCSNTYNSGEIHLYDFRTAPEKLTRLIEFQTKIKEIEISVHGEPDVSFEGGFITLDFDQKTKEAFQSYDTAIEVFEDSDSTDSFVHEKFRGIPWIPPKGESIEVLVMDFGETHYVMRDVEVDTMDRYGYRPLLLSELMLLSVKRPELVRRNETLCTYEKHMFDGRLEVPYLNFREGSLFLGAVSVGYVGDAQYVTEWSERDRFLFTRK